jgi:hypothetical protein
MAAHQPNESKVLVLNSKSFDWRVTVRDRIKVAPDLKDMKDEIETEKGKSRKIKFSSEAGKIVHAHAIPHTCTVTQLLSLCERLDDKNFVSHISTVSSNVRILQPTTEPKKNGRPVYFITVGSLTSYKIRMRNKVIFSCHSSFRILSNVNL